MKFILTKELGRLAKWLRILGFDTVYLSLANASTLLITALQENRIIVTRNSRLGVHPGVRLVKITSDFLAEQLQQLFQELAFSLDAAKTFSRCLICNKELVPVEKELIKTKVPEFVYQTQDSFVACPACSRVYWPGTHWGNVKKLMAKLSYC